MKKYQVKINNMNLEIIQDDDGKFITPYLCIEDWGKFGTALKPSFEPIIVARKPFKGSLVDNVKEYGVGGINIDECRVGNEKIEYYPTNLEEAHGNKFGNGAYMPKDTTKPPITHTGRFPANTILTYDETDFDEVCGGFPNTKTGIVKVGNTNSNGLFGSGKTFIPNQTNGGDSGSASRYFYCAKASKKDRDEGLDVEIEEYALKEDTPKEMEQLILNSLTS